MKRTILLAIFLCGLLLGTAGGAAAQTATPGSGSFTIYNQGNVLGDSDIASIRTAAANFPVPLVVYITNQYKGAKIDFSRIVAKYVTDNNVVIGISALQDSSGNYHYRLLGAGPHSGVSASVLDGAQTQMDTYLRASGGPQYTSAIVSAVGYIQGSLSSSSGSSGGVSNSNGGSNSGGSSGSFWDLVLGLIVLAFIIWLVFLFIRWLWRLSHPVSAARQQGNATATTTRGGGYYDSGPIYYPIWLGGGSYGGGGSSSSGASPSPTPNTGGGSLSTAFGGGGGAATSNTGGGNFESSFAPSGGGGGGSSSSSSNTGSGVFESAVNAGAASAATNAAIGEVAGAAVNILGGILGAVFSAGSGGSGPDF